jgi:prepilin-type N-terminal cleavage/methylation domain-containing protein
MIVKKDHGVTLIELMIVMVIAAFLVAGIYSLFITQHRSYTVQDQVAGIQQDARVALDIMARDIRMAGFLTEAGSSSGFGGISVNTHNFAVEPVNGGTNNPDEITVVFAAEQATTVMNVVDKQVTLDTGGVSHFIGTGKPYVAFEGENNVYQISGIAGDTLTLTNAPPASLDDPGFGTHALLVKAITYNVQNNALTRDEHTGAGAQPLAGDGVNTVVEDLQIAYQVAGSNDWIFDADTAVWPAGKTNADIRMVRINIIVRTVVPDPQETSFFKPGCEDRPQENTFTGCRRRVYTTVVKARNL